MRYLILAGMLLGSAAAQAQQQQFTGPGSGSVTFGLPKPVTLSLSVEQVQMIVQALPLIECRTVGQLATCRLAEKTLEAIREQAKEQVK